MNLRDYVTTVLDTRATSDDDLDFEITFLEFNAGVGHLTFTKEEAELPEKELFEVARTRYDELRVATVAKHGWSAPFAPGPDEPALKE